MLTILQFLRLVMTSSGFRKMDRLDDVITSIRLTINFDKTKFVLFRDAIELNDPVAVRHCIRDCGLHGRSRQLPNGRIIFGEKVEAVDSFNYLGVVLDKFLKFHAHVEKSIRLANKTIGALSKVLRLQGLDVKKKVWVYKVAVRPILYYGCPTWILIPPRDMEKLIQVEYKTIRAMYRRPERRQRERGEEESLCDGRPAESVWLWNKAVG